MVKINMGCGWRDFGSNWTHIDGGDYQHLDYHSITKLDFEDNSVDLIYASHVLEYFDRIEVYFLLEEWARVLKPEATLRVAVPNFAVLSALYQSGEMQLKHVLGPLYGRMKMDNETIYHKTVYDFEDLRFLLTRCGFRSIREYDWRSKEHAKYDDHSQAYFPHMDKENGTLVSLNVECSKI